MKYIVLIGLNLILFSTRLQAQDELLIRYEVKHKFEIPKVEGLDSAMMAQLPKESKSIKELFYADQKSVYMSQPKAEEPMKADDNGRRIVINMDENEDICFVDYTKKEQINQRDFMGRTFLVKATLDVPKWKLTGKQKTILGYNCQEIEQVEGDHSVKLWFTPQLSAQVGPDTFVGFPGAILAVEMDNGKHIISALEIKTSGVPRDKINAPKEGKKTTPQEFQKIVEEKQKEMMEQNGGDGQTVIKIIRN